MVREGWFPREFTWRGARSLDEGLHWIGGSVFEGRRPTDELMRAVDVYGALYARAGLELKITFLGQVDDAAKIGIVLDALQSNSSFEPLRDACVTALREHRHLPIEVISEASAAHLMMRLGWRADKQTESTHPTADLRCTRGQEIMEVEVVCSRQKLDSLNRERHAASIIDSMNPRPGMTIVVHFLEQLSDCEIAQIDRVASELELGSRREVPERWAVDLVPLVDQDAPSPAWWPRQNVQYYTARAGHTSRVTVLWAQSYYSYRNSVLRKINANQFSGAMPAAIAWDTAELIDGVRWLRQAGEELLGISDREPNITSDHVSGLIGFSNMLWANGVAQWNYHVISNPHARHLLSPSVRTGDGCFEVRLWEA